MNQQIKPDEPIPWMNNAACANVGGDQWFPDSGGSTVRVKQICATCPVATQCLDYAQTNMIPEGIFGGLSPRERRMLRRKEVA